MVVNYYFYKMTCADGGAPCVQDGVLSLAICKPIIRSTAKENDFLFGFAANSLYPDNRLVYIAEITHKLEDGDYYKELFYRNRLDSIYLFEANKYKLKDGASFHKEGMQMDRDIGKFPEYSRLKVLISSNFRYFPEGYPINYEAKYFSLSQSIKKLTVGHRVNHSKELSSELDDLKNMIFAQDEGKIESSIPSKFCEGLCHNKKCREQVKRDGLTPRAE
jgi:hypothetical protein